MELNVYLNFDGQALEALDFYAKVFEAPKGQTTFFKDIPDQKPGDIKEEYMDRVMHSELQLANIKLMIADVMDNPLITGNNVNLSFNTEDKAELERIFDALSQEGQVMFPLSETFWSPAFGMLVDKFGISWMFNLGM